MANELSINSLLTNFPIPSKGDWIKAAVKETGRTDPLQLLTWKATKELSFLPIYDRSDLNQRNDTEGFDLTPSGDEHQGARFWYNLPAVEVDDAATANQMALAHLREGANGILFLPSGDPDPRVLLHHIDLSICNVSFQLGQKEGVRELRDYCSHHRTPVNINLMWESAPFRPDLQINEWRGIKGVRALGLIVPNRDDVVSEIANALFDGVTLLDNLTDAGLSPHEVMPHIHFSMKPGTDFFAGIAKLKALRRLWYQITRAYGVDDTGYDRIFIHCRCEPLTNDRYEPRGSLLSNTVSSIAAICGGCNALTVFADKTEGHAGRTARNVSAILGEEAHLNTVADPVAGSYFVESLVHDASKAAWEVFTNMSKPE